MTAKTPIFYVITTGLSDIFNHQLKVKIPMSLVENAIEF